MTKALGVGAFLVSTVAAATPMTVIPGTADTGWMLLIGAGLVVSASIARQKLRSR